MRARRKVREIAAPSPAPGYAAAAEAGLPSLPAAMDACPFRSVITPNGQLTAILGAWAIMQGPALPMPAEALADAEHALSHGGCFLILATEWANRDAAKAALLLALTPSWGAA